MKDYTQADIYNNASIMEDPDYFDAYLRKCEIYEDMCEYSLAVNLATWIAGKLFDIQPAHESVYE